MKLEEIHLEPNQYFEEFRNIYDKYAHSYNSFTKDTEKIRFTADLAVIKKEYADRCPQLNDEITGYLHLLKKQIYQYCGISVEEKMSGGESLLVPDGKSVTQFPGSQALDYVLSWLPSLLNTIKRGVKFDDQLKALKQSYRELLESIEHPTDFEQKHVRILQQTLEKCKRYYKLSTQIEVIETLTEQIGERNYPQTVDTFEELPKEDRKELMDGKASVIIENIAQRISGKGTGKYKMDTIDTYLTIFIHNRNLTKDRRLKLCEKKIRKLLKEAREEEDDKNIATYESVLEEIESGIPHSTLNSWEGNYMERWYELKSLGQ